MEQEEKKRRNPGALKYLNAEAWNSDAVLHTGVSTMKCPSLQQWKLQRNYETDTGDIFAGKRLDSEYPCELQDKHLEDQNFETVEVPWLSTEALPQWNVETLKRYHSETSRHWNG